MSAATASFGVTEFAVLERLAAAGDAVPGELGEELDLVWEGTRRLLEQVGRRVLPNGFELELWPWREGDDLFPFVWARLKEDGLARFATHLGLFLSPTHCNCSIDLEKDPLDAGESAETLEQVLAYYEGGEWARYLTDSHPDLRLWTDTLNVVTPVELEERGVAAFMAANRDPAHPWPKVGYLLEAEQVAAFGDRLADELEARFASLLPVYRSMIASF